MLRFATRALLDPRNLKPFENSLREIAFFLLILPRVTSALSTNTPTRFIRYSQYNLSNVNDPKHGLKII